MFKTQEELFEALGLPLPEKAEDSIEETEEQEVVEESEETQEVAEPVENESEETQEVAEPAQEQDEEIPEEKKDNGKADRDLETDSKFAAARRKAEEEAKLKLAALSKQKEEEAQKKLDSWIASQGYMNPTTGQPITTQAEYELMTEAEAEKSINEGEYNAEAIKTVINAQLRKNTSAIEQSRKEREEAEAEIQRNIEIEAQFNLDFATIKEKYDNTLTSVDDLLDKPYTEALRDKISKGNSLLEAYEVINIDSIIKKQAEKTKRAETVKANSKNHLTANKSKGGKTEASVPPDVLRYYRQLNPDATDEEIQKHYNKQATLKKKGG